MFSRSAEVGGFRAYGLGSTSGSNPDRIAWAFSTLPKRQPATLDSQTLSIVDVSTLSLLQVVKRCAAQHVSLQNLVSPA